METLSFNENGTFQIALLSDLHFGEDDVKDRNSSELISRVLESENIDFVIFTGDQISGQLIHDIESMKFHWVKVLEPVNRSGIRFATMFGNHDDMPYQFESIMAWHEGALIALMIVLALLAISILCGCISCAVTVFVITMAVVYLLAITSPTKTIRQTLVQHERSLFPALSYTQSGPESMHGVSNFFLSIKFANNTAVMLFFLDSGGGRIPAKIVYEQEQWLLSNSPPHVPSLVFFHIPTPEYRDPHIGCIGDANENPDIAPSQIMRHFQNTRAVITGHDHGNSWCCPQDDLTYICYARHTGYGGYGNWKRGVRIISLNMSQILEIKTWIHMDDDAIEDEIMLSSQRVPPNK
jgi:hypothetical protein